MFARSVESALVFSDVMLVNAAEASFKGGFSNAFSYAATAIAPSIVPPVTASFAEALSAMTFTACRESMNRMSRVNVVFMVKAD